MYACVIVCPLRNRVWVCISMCTSIYKYVCTVQNVHVHNRNSEQIDYSIAFVRLRGEGKDEDMECAVCPPIGQSMDYFSALIAYEHQKIDRAGNPRVAIHFIWLRVRHLIN